MCLWQWNCFAIFNSFTLFLSCSDKSLNQAPWNATCHKNSHNDILLIFLLCLIMLCMFLWLLYNSRHLEGLCFILCNIWLSCLSPEQMQNLAKSVRSLKCSFWGLCSLWLWAGFNADEHFTPHSYTDMWYVAVGS